MPELIKVYEGKKLKTTLTFRGKEFVISSVLDDRNSRKWLDEDFEDQLTEAFPDDKDIEDIAFIADDIGFHGPNDDNDIQEKLRKLAQYENS